MKILKYLRLFYAHQSMGEDVHVLIGLLIALVVCPLICYEIVNIVGRLSERQVARTFGPHVQIIVGGVGEVLHEYSNMLMAFIFGHTTAFANSYSIADIKEGYGLSGFDHDWDAKNFVQEMGNFVIGVMPFYIVSLILYGWQYLLMGNPASDLSPWRTSNAMKIVDEGFASCFKGGNIITVIIFMIPTIMIVSAGFNSTKTTFLNVLSGIFEWAGFILALTVILCLFGIAAQAIPLMNVILAWSPFLMIRAIVYLVITLIITSVFTVLNKVL